MLVLFFFYVLICAHFINGKNGWIANCLNSKLFCNLWPMRYILNFARMIHMYWMPEFICKPLQSQECWVNTTQTPLQQWCELQINVSKVSHADASVSKQHLFQLIPHLCVERVSRLLPHYHTRPRLDLYTLLVSKVDWIFFLKPNKFIIYLNRIPSFLAHATKWHFL